MMRQPTDPMSTRPPDDLTHPLGQPESWAVFAASILVIVGALQAIWGAAALLNPSSLDVVDKSFILGSAIAWGWITLVMGLVLIVTGVALFARQSWARWVTIVVAGLSAVAAIGWLPSHPIWGLVVIGLDVLVINDLARHWARERNILGSNE